jgi:hypothetical protein
MRSCFVTSPLCYHGMKSCCSTQSVIKEMIQYYMSARVRSNYAFDFPTECTCTIACLYCLLNICYMFRHSLHHQQGEILSFLKTSVYSNNLYMFLLCTYTSTLSGLTLILRLALSLLYINTYTSIVSALTLTH